MFRSSTFKYAILAAIASGICGFLHSLPLLGSLPTQGSLAAAARGIATLRNLNGFGTASTIDVIAARLWQSGGSSLLSTGHSLSVFGAWTVATFLALGGVWVIGHLLNDARARGILVGSAVILLLMTCIPPLWETIAKRGERVSDLRLVMPVELIARTREIVRPNIFSNPSAFAPLLLLAPDSTTIISIQDSARLSMNAGQWREGFRTARWNTILLSGPVSEYRPLLEHLLGSPDWHLASITNHGFLFLQGSGLPIRSLDRNFALDNQRDTAVYLAQICAYYDAIRRTGDARACIERALKLAPDNMTVLSHAATFAAAHKRWQDALDYSARVLARDNRLVHPKLIQALAFLETGEANKAQELVDQALLEVPDDSYALFLSARVRRSLHDYGREAQSLEKIVAISQNAKTPTANYLIYLGQAYARQSLPELALKNYRAALNSGELDPRQVEEVQDAIKSIESQTPP